MTIPACYAAGYEAARGRDPDLAEAYVRHTTRGDPAADAVVEDLAAIGQEGRWHRIIGGAIENYHDPPEGTPESLRRLIAEADVSPDWYDRDLAMLATRAFIRNAEVVLAALSTGAIVEGFATLISKSFRIRGRIMLNGVRRLRQNLLQLVEQYLPGGVEPGGDAWRLSLRIRLVHAQSRRLVRNSRVWDEAIYGLPLSGAHMALGAAAFSGRLMQHVAALGGDFSAEERDAYVHVWRCTASTMGIPSELMFHDEASALRAFEIASLCEPPPDDDAIIMANSIINSAPVLLGFTESDTRRREASHYYQMSRELIGDRLADAFRYPKPYWFRLLPLLRAKHRVERFGAQVLPVWSKVHGLQSFNLLLKVSNLQKLELSYSLPTTLHDEDSLEW